MYRALSKVALQKKEKLALTWSFNNGRINDEIVGAGTLSYSRYVT